MMFAKIKFFQKAAVLIFALFMGLMIAVTIIAYSRRSGHTGLDMAKVQQMRQDGIASTQD